MGSLYTTSSEARAILSSSSTACSTTIPRGCSNWKASPTRDFEQSPIADDTTFPIRIEFVQIHSASLEADDLAALIDELKLGKAHIVGHSYGAYTALMFALNYPDRCLSVTLAEPPIIPWLADLPDDPSGAGKAQLAKLMNEGIEPAKAALDSGDEEGAILIMFDCISGEGKYDSLPGFVKEKCRRNVSELKALVYSEDRFPEVDRQRVGRLALPTLIVSGSESVATARFTDPELERLIPERFRERVVFEGGTHIMWIEQPVIFRETVLGFIR